MTIEDKSHKAIEAQDVINLSHREVEFKLEKLQEEHYIYHLAHATLKSILAN